MALTKEDLKAIADLINIKLDEHGKRFDAIDKRLDTIDQKFDDIDKRFDNLRTEFKEMLVDNNMIIAEHVQRVVLESEERLSKEISEIRDVTAQNSYDIAYLKRKIS
ncbi:MAG TPA: hypothetical protein GX396_03435 [Tissierellia bacterium]|jgi:archaellum component FlaC|nr:hypothetical protein [Tissierellia bacterium]